MLGFGATGQFAIGQVGTAGGSEFIGPDKWFIALSEPVRFKIGLSAVEQQTLALFPNPIVSFGWFGNLSEPVRIKPRNPAALSPYLFFQPAPSPFVATGWYNWLSEPIRLKPGLGVQDQSFFFYQANPTTVTPFAWYASLSEPVRQKIGLKAFLQQFETQAPQFIPAPATLIDGWFNWLSEPKRFLKGLGAPYQIYFTANPRILPNPNVTVNINMIELDTDLFQVAINVVKSNTPVSARVSIVEIGNGLSPTAVIEH